MEESSMVNPCGILLLDIIMRQKLVAISHKDLDMNYYSSLPVLVDIAGIMSKIFVPDD